MSKFVKAWISVGLISAFLLVSLLSFIGGVFLTGYSITTNPEAYEDIVCEK
ncbi:MULTISPECIES: hypothetical protein [Lysinibacillus]|uniref:hypothetical protein n=1 Tax=Lysinibacillus TaxID=400634 RepID=UPI00214B67FB|nr:MULTISPECIES: hypothetical protein [Lysinibacillus]UUV25917.1 hypothetical protein NP781_04675 [Lysinibacillus sp. FN11]UYB48790.1 hypothetical protein OCI51_07465 [Lysinibacillus capsici]